MNFHAAFFSIPIALATPDGGLAGYELLGDLVMAVIAAFVGGIVAVRLKLPVITGYLLAGIAIGPFTPGPVSNVERVQTMAELGVALLMFALGTQFSLHELKEIGTGAALGGVIQIVLVMLLGVPVGLWLGLPLTEAIYLGGMLAISSSIVMLKLLLARSEVSSLHGKLALGTGVVQDICVVVLVVVLPAIASNTGTAVPTEVLLGNIGLALLKAAAFLGGTFFIGTRLIPWLLYRVIKLGVREIFLLTILIIAVGTALLAQLIGVSFALGAFLAGMIVSESDVADDVLNEIIPIRDVFATLFFVSIGMLINPVFIFTNFGEVLLITVAILGGKLAIVVGILSVLRYPLSTSLRTGLLLAQIGEFSFILARLGSDSGSISKRTENLTLAGALVTIILMPVLYQLAPFVISKIPAQWFEIAKFAKSKKVNTVSTLEPANNNLEVIPDFDRAGRDPLLDMATHRAMSKRDNRTPLERWPYRKHIIITGYGRVGRELAEAIRRRNLDLVIIEFDKRRAQEAVEKGFKVLVGDATTEITLKQANVAEAKLVAVTTPDLTTAEGITRMAIQLNPTLEIITRASDSRAIAALKAAGAKSIVQPEIEASLEFIRRTLRTYGVGSVELQALINGRREKHYGQ